MKKIKNSYDVVIVGAGPCGVTAASLLGQQGINTLIIDTEADILTIPRAIGICEEGSRVMQAAQVLSDFEEHLRPINKVIFADKQHQSLFHLDIKPDRNGYCELRTFFQPDLERLLRQRLARYSSVNLQLSTTLLDFNDTKNGVSVVIARGDNTHAVHCRYLLACDGAKSSIRKKLDIGFSGSTYPQDWMILDVKNNPVPSDTVVFSIDPSRPSVTLPGPDDKRRWEFLIKDGEDPETLCSHDNLRKLVRSWGDIDDMVVERKAVYTFHARTAKRFRKGNTFLLGDAAHITPPFAGQGMMAGLRDANNLSWKLAAVIQGRAEPKLLDSYERERLPQCQQIISVAQFMGRIILPQKKLAALSRNLLIGLFGKLGFHSPDRGAPLQKIPNHINGSILRHLLISSWSKTGAEFPQHWLQSGSGEKKLFDDLVGNHFLILSWQRSSQSLLTENLRQRWYAVGGKFACIRGGDDKDGGIGKSGDKKSGAESSDRDHLTLRDPEQHYREYFEDGERIVVIRPDKMVIINCTLSNLNQKLERYLNRLGAPVLQLAGAA